MRKTYISLYASMKAESSAEDMVTCVSLLQEGFSYGVGYMRRHSSVSCT